MSPSWSGSVLSATSTEECVTSDVGAAGNGGGFLAVPVSMPLFCVLSTTSTEECFSNDVAAAGNGEGLLAVAASMSLFCLLNSSIYSVNLDWNCSPMDCPVRSLVRRSSSQRSCELTGLPFYLMNFEEECCVPE